MHRDTPRRLCHALGYIELNMLDDLEAGKPKTPLDRELKSYVVRLAVEAYRREEISRGRLLDIGKLLSMRGSKLVELAQAAAGTE